MAGAPGTTPRPWVAVLQAWVHRAAPRTPTTGGLWETPAGVLGRSGMSTSRRRSPRAVNPGVEAPRPQNSNFLLSPLKMSWDTGIAVRVSLHALTARGTASPPSLVRADPLSSALPRDPDAPPPKLRPQEAGGRRMRATLVMRTGTPLPLS